MTLTESDALLVTSAARARGISIFVPVVLAGFYTRHAIR
jgi:hypothetical protein